MKPQDMLREFARYGIGSFVGAFFVFFGGMMVASPAFAQSVVTAGVDFAPTLNTMIGIFGTIATVGGGIVIKALVTFVAAKTGVKNTELSVLAEDKLDRALFMAINYATVWMKTQVADPNNKLIHDVKFDNFFLEQAVKYALNSIPGWILDHFKLRTASGEIDTARISDMITARLNKLIPNPVSASDEVKIRTTELVAKTVEPAI